MGLYTNFHITGHHVVYVPHSIAMTVILMSLFTPLLGLHVVAPGFALGRLAKDGVLQPSDVVMEYALW